jgi:ribonuclease/clavin/mitogillin
MPETSSPLYEKLLSRDQQPKPTRPPRHSVSVVPWRRHPSGEIEVYWVERSLELAFMGGWHAFPGGGLSRRDAGVAVTGLPAGITETSFSDPLPGQSEAVQRQLGPDLVPGLLTCGLRELFEETGLLPGQTADHVDVATLARSRRQLLAEELDFATLVADLGLKLDAEDLVFAGRWLTPPLSPIRFDNRFFLLEWPASRRLQPEILPGELATGEWIAPADAAARWEQGEVILAPPILHLLRVLGEDGPKDGLERLRFPHEANIGPTRRIEFRPGVIILPLRTATFLPATHTNTYLLGREEVVLVDPAPTAKDQIDILTQAVDAAQAQGRKVSAIWLTHHHPDHVGSVNLMRERLGVPVAAHPLTAERLAGRGIAVDQELHGGERIELGGSSPFPVRILHTPGHAQGHLAFYDETHGSLLAGDLVAGIGTIMVDPPEGNMDDYLQSLERMIELAPKTLFPAHGPVILQAVKKFIEYRDHPHRREALIAKACRDGASSLEQIVAKAYEDVAVELHPIAARQAMAHLERLRRRGEIDS